MRDGYVNSRVFTLATPSPGALEVVEGRIAELRIKSPDLGLQKEIKKRLNSLIGSVLHLPSLEKALVNVRSMPGVGQITGNLGRLGSDATQAKLSLTVDPAPTPWLGEVSIRNDGNIGTGEWRSITTVMKNNLVKRNDNFLAYFEMNSDSDPELGATITSTSYTWPLSENWRLIGSFGHSRRQLVEASDDAHEISFRQLQAMGQVETTLYRSTNQLWSAFAGISGNRNDSYLAGDSIPLVLGGGPDGWLRSGYLRGGINFSGSIKDLAWNSNIYGLQGIAGFSTESQLKELAWFGINPGEARAIGGLANLHWGLSPNVILKLRGAGQWAFNHLPSDMGFSIGSDVGLRGLPGSLISGDSGWLGVSELIMTAWRKDDQALQIVPFLGMGGVRTDFNDIVFEDTIGSGGILTRYYKGSWMLELGWVNSFESSDNQGIWQEWLLGDGLYAHLKYRF